MIPIACTVPNWDTFLILTDKLLGRSVARGLDSKNITTRGLAEFVAALGEFHTVGTNPSVIQRDAGFLLKHATVSFLATLTRDQVVDLLVAGCVKVLDCECDGLVILTASLEDWRSTVINLCSHNQTASMCVLGTQILRVLDEMGLASLFENYSRRSANQGGLTLTRK